MLEAEKAEANKKRKGKMPEAETNKKSRRAEGKVDFSIKVGKWRAVSQDSFFLGFHETEKMAIKTVKEYSQIFFLYIFSR